jgi:hypothetical protein
LSRARLFGAHENGDFYLQINGYLHIIQYMNTDFKPEKSNAISENSPVTLKNNEPEEKTFFQRILD